MQRILVIEDSTEYREFIGELLRLCGYELLEADDGEGGIRMADSAAPDLIICDLHLPHVDGFGALEAIRKHAGDRRVPFIFLSGDGDPLHVRRGLSLGAEAYLVKPVSAKEFVLAVKRLLLPDSNGRSIHPTSEQTPSSVLLRTVSE